MRWSVPLAVALVACTGPGSGAGKLGDTASYAASEAGFGGGGGDYDASGSGTTGTWGSSGTGGGTGGGTGSGGSTSWDGGTETEPEETEPPDTGTFDCITDVPTELFLSPDDSNSMSSAVLAREAVAMYGSERLPPIRTYEFFNYYDFDYAPAAPGELAVTLELAQDPEMAGDEYVLQVAIASERRTHGDRDPIDLTMVVDTSCSMGGTPIALTRDVCRTVASQLQAGDIVNMVTWAEVQDLVLENHEVSGPGDGTLLGKCESIEEGGGTNLSAGLDAGYRLAELHASPDRVDRMLLISDGGANLGITDEELIAEKADDGNQGGIYLAGVGVGVPGTYNDMLMDAVTDAGKGAAIFASDTAEVDRVLGDRFLEVFDVAARNVQLELTLPGGFEIVRFSAEEIGTSARDVEPQHLAPNDAMVFHQHLWTCAPELVSDDTIVTATVRWQDVLTGELHELVQEATFAEMLGGDTSNLRKGAAVFAYAEALKIVRKEGRAAAADAVARAFDALGVAETVLGADSELTEMRRVLEGL